ncbi:MAG: bifunctional hydroxymethylpyrimidine kinase/phosphomethylpyrimidine kinase, partial [Candidatus Dormibacteria bacterium]
MSAEVPPTPIAATVATSDSGGGAGIQADLKAFAAWGAHGVSVLVALTAQNTVEVEAVQPVSAALIRTQFRVLDADLRPRAVKTGMLLSASRIRLVTEELRQRDWGPLVVDPVMVAKSGARLLEEDALPALRVLLGLALVVTPNWPEAAVLAGRPVSDEAGAMAAAASIAEMGPQYVVVKGGHSPGAPDDLVLHRGRVRRLPGQRLETRHTHGTGCTFSAATTALLAHGLDPSRALRLAKGYVSAAIREAPG